ncbi:diaminopropionate ammonia-lyase [Flavisphingomonas formosensis]|uniref:diaminopropionate ammonia-lyase n=1 Tax=Flavisphingomonas formosensis TaxID=861534 RepID=UPI0012F8211B|nr:diaminopropionate ammonia-lyase [Sphingomonas formosensis]
MIANPNVDRTAPYADGRRETILSGSAFEIARREIRSWPGFAETALRSLPTLAAETGVGALYYKDEGSRFGLGSFKALGGAYAVLRLLQKIVGKATGETPGSADFMAGSHADLRAGVTVTCATDGNHGRSVAWGAQNFGCRCVIYVHETVSQGRVDAIARFGAEVRRVAGNYDDAVRRASADAAAHGWHVLSDTSYEGYVDVPRDVMQGYALMVDEALAAMPAPPSHVFVQGGVGGLAAAVCATLWERFGAARPICVVVEPDAADCLCRSAAAGHPVAVEGALDTIMAGLACGEVSLLAWDILSPGADAFMAIPDDAAAQAMRLLADTVPPVIAGESAVAGLAGLRALRDDAEARRLLGLGDDSVVLLFGTEGATDPDVYRAIVGRSAEALLA